MIPLRASDFTLDEVHKLLQLEEREGVSFESLLILQPITETDRHDLELIVIDLSIFKQVRFLPILYYQN